MRILGCVLLLGCGLACKGEPAAQAPVVIDYALGDYFFQGPDTIQAGLVTFRLKLESHASHVLDLVKLEQGKRLADLMAAGESAYDSSWVKSVGGGVTSPDSTSPMYTLQLEPGLYVMICYFHAPDHQPHFAKGMIKELVVRLPDLTPTPPQPDMEVQLISFGFKLSAPITAGAHVIRAVNPSDEPHELIFARLADGYTLEQAKAREDSTDPKGPSPWRNYGGVADLSPGDTTVMTANFPPGTYRMYCFFQTKDEPLNHAQRGMAEYITVN